MRTDSATLGDAVVPGSAAGSTGAMGAGPPEMAASASQPPAQPGEARPTPKYLDPQWKYEGVPDTKFYKDYPPDAWGEEAAPNARVWKIYRDEMTSGDATMLESWNKTLDVLLIFAGLFSAVSTAFIIESYKSLQPDYTQYVANFLYAAATSNAALNGGITLLPTVEFMGPPDSFVHPSATQRWTNGLWFTSLAVSLTVALLCILIKQWLDEYSGRVIRSAPSLRHWARRHQLYFRGLQAWGVPALISFLPLLLHVSLFLFFAGLVLFLRPLDGLIADTQLGILTFMLLIYVLSLVIPAWRVECPSSTPLLAQARSATIFSFEILLQLIESFRRLVSIRHSGSFLRDNAIVDRILKTINRVYWKLDVFLARNLARRKLRFAQEATAVDAQQFDLDGRALTTLLVSTNDADIIDAGVEAIGAISSIRTLEVIVREKVAEDIIDERACRKYSHTDATPTAFAVMTDARRVRTFATLGPTRMRLNGYSHGYSHPMVDLYQFLGLDGVFVQLMAVGEGGVNDDEAAAVATAFLELLLAHVVKLSSGAVSGYTGLMNDVQLLSRPTRSICLTFLTMFDQLGRLERYRQHRIPCLLLTFCAGDFAHSDRREQTSALWIVLSALEEMPQGSAMFAIEDDPLDALDRFFATLAANEEFRANDQTFRLLAHHLGLLCDSMRPTDLRWSQVTGFSAFVQLPQFEHYVSRAALKGFIALLQRVHAPRRDDTQQFQQYWMCVATLLKLSCDFILPSDTFSDWIAGGLPWGIAPLLSHPQNTIPFHDPTHDTMLSLLLHIPAAVGSRIFRVGLNDHPYVKIAEGLSFLLCRRHRLGPVDTALVDRLFAGPFLTNQFHALVTGEYYHPPPDQGLARTMLLAKHCARLSLSDMLLICDELQNPRGDRTALDDQGTTLVARIRRGVLPDGELNGECDPSCSCMIPPAVRPPKESGAKRWRNRILGNISAVPDSPA